MAWNQSTGEAAKPQPKKPSALRGVIAGVAVVAAAVAVFFAMSGKDEKPKVKVEKEPGRIKEVKPAAAPKVEVDTTELKKAEDKARRARLAKMTPQERREMFMQKIVEEPLDLTPVSNRVYKTGLEQQISLIFMTQPGNPPPFLAQIPVQEEVHLLQILENSVKITGEDSEAVKQSKETVEAVKRELAKYVQEGGEVKDFLAYYHSLLMDSFKERNDAQSSVYKVIREDPSIAADYVKKVNERLEAKGIKPIYLAKRVADRIGYTQDNVSSDKQGE